MCNLLSSLFFPLSQTSYLTFLLCEKLALGFPLKKFWWWCMMNLCVPGMPFFCLFFFFPIITLYSLIERACVFIINRIIDLFDYHVLSIYLTYSRPSLYFSLPSLALSLEFGWLKMASVGFPSTSVVLYLIILNFQWVTHKLNIHP